MADEFELDLNEDENINRTEQRIKDLSSKAKTFAQERDDAKAAAEAAEARAASLEKEKEFYASFSTNIAKYPGAAEHTDAIKEKVLAGYSVEDATVSVLNAEGKLMPQAQIETYTAPEPAAGGSATTPPLAGPSTEASGMTQEERRAALLEADKRGELAQILQRQ